MPTTDKFDPAKEVARVATWHATLTWISLSERFPDSRATVLVRMADGRVAGAEWYADERTWTHSAFSYWNEPVAWAALEKLHSSR